MICPEGEVDLLKDDFKKEETRTPKENNLYAEGSSGVDIKSSSKNLKTWKKSITKFFRTQLRPTRSNDGDAETRQECFTERNEMSPDQKWQSLGKIFRRQSFAGDCRKPTIEKDENKQSSSKRSSMKRAITNYFGKYPKPPGNETNDLSKM